MKNKKLLFLILIFLLPVFFLSCYSDTTIKSEDLPSDLARNIQIPQLKQAYPFLLKEAQKWNPDAQLERAGIRIKEDQEYVNEVYAFFEITGNEYDYLFVEYIESAIVPGDAGRFGVPNHSFIPILLDDWKIDSDEAWKIFLTRQDAFPSKPELVESIDILLVRKLINEELRLIWRFSLMDQDRNFLIDASIDANTGEFIELDRH